ncbi:two component transcriptional regulator, LytTR family [Paenibacillus curdlanolyticus YK9]|uniref:Two component transcriptional regulator, LytTR family n=1 Tax=Paenibacillus curdlanolyticus YK9 TaxID=717606 RepID=E0I5Y4_9BACL|nr:LytTR family DNA-binding domain-containing protein [Paenibacillus curdlanolyticus]EFM12376.1 two component transcriptional regulator, LytTR family [Paenibacillus curdlanolyticus YK9]
MFNIAVCDNDAYIHKQLESSFLMFADKTHLSFDIRYFSSGEELLQFYKGHKHPFHIIILDIEMEGKNGIDTAKEIRALPDRDVLIIFLTHYPEYMMQSFDVQGFQYLIKPISNQLFEKKISFICNYLLSSINRYVIVKTDQMQMMIRSCDVVAITKIKHCIAKNRLEVITTEKRLMSTGTLSEYTTTLKFPFMAVHRSIFVNIEHIVRFTSTKVIMSTNDEFPIGRSYIKQVKDTFARLMITRFMERGF